MLKFESEYFTIIATKHDGPKQDWTITCYAKQEERQKCSLDNLLRHLMGGIEVLLYHENPERSYCSLQIRFPNWARGVILGQIGNLVDQVIVNFTLVD